MYLSRGVELNCAPNIAANDVAETIILQPDPLCTRPRACEGAGASFTRDPDRFCNLRHHCITCSIVSCGTLTTPTIYPNWNAPMAPMSVERRSDTVSFPCRRGGARVELSRLIQSPPATPSAPEASLPAEVHRLHPSYQSIWSTKLHDACNSARHIDAWTREACLRFIVEDST